MTNLVALKHLIGFGLVRGLLGFRLKVVDLLEFLEKFVGSVMSRIWLWVGDIK